MSRREDEPMNPPDEMYRVEWDADGHVSEESVHAWLDRQTGVNDTNAIELHVAACATCADAVAEARGLKVATSRIVGALDVAPAGIVPRDDVARTASRIVAMANAADKSALLRKQVAARPFWQNRMVLRAAAAIVVVAGGSTLLMKGSGAPVFIRSVVLADSSASLRAPLTDPVSPMQPRAVAGTDDSTRSNAKNRDEIAVPKKSAAIANREAVKARIAVTPPVALPAPAGSVAMEARAGSGASMAASSSGAIQPLLPRPFKAVAAGVAAAVADVMDSGKVRRDSTATPRPVCAWRIVGTRPGRAPVFRALLGALGTMGNSFTVVGWPAPTDSVQALPVLQSANEVTVRIFKDRAQLEVRLMRAGVNWSGVADERRGTATRTDSIVLVPTGGAACAN